MPKPFTFKFIPCSEAPKITPGTILFLPPQDQIPKGTYVDPKLQNGAFNHPIIVVGLAPTSNTTKPEPTTPTSVILVAIMTSFANHSIKSHLATNRNLKIRTGVQAAKFAGYLRVVTANKPFAKDCLKLKGGKGMKRDSSYVGLRNVYSIAIGALAFYGREKEVDGYKLTAHSLGLLENGLLEWKEKGKRREEVKETEKRNVVRKGKMKKQRVKKERVKRERVLPRSPRLREMQMKREEETNKHSEDDDEDEDEEPIFKRGARRLKTKIL